MRALNIETHSWAAARNLIGQRIATHTGKREPRPAKWNIEIQRNLHSIPMGAVVATARLIECMQVMTEPDFRGSVDDAGT